MNLQFLRHEVKEPNPITIYPLVCMHYGTAEADIPFVRKHVQRILDDPYGVGVYLGDAGECVTKHSKGDIFNQDLNPQAQLNAAVADLRPLADANKLLFGINGNHGRRIQIDTGMDFDMLLCDMLRIPYLGVAGFLKLKMYGTYYDIFFHHGASGSISTAGKVTAGLKFNAQVEADAVMTAHTHACMAIDPQTIAVLPTSKQEIAWRSKHAYICGCAYDSRQGYAEVKGYAPILPAYVGVTFYPDLHKEGRRKQDHKIYRADPNSGRHR